jgi:hypothetical protein
MWGLAHPLLSEMVPPWLCSTSTVHTSQRRHWWGFDASCCLLCANSAQLRPVAVPQGTVRPASTEHIRNIYICIWKNKEKTCQITLCLDVIRCTSTPWRFFSSFSNRIYSIRVRGMFSFLAFANSIYSIRVRRKEKKRKKRRNTPSDDLIASALLWMPDRYCISVFFSGRRRPLVLQLITGIFCNDFNRNQIKRNNRRLFFGWLSSYFYWQRFFFWDWWSGEDNVNKIFMSLQKCWINGQKNSTVSLWYYMMTIYIVFSGWV